MPEQWLGMCASSLEDRTFARDGQLWHVPADGPFDGTARLTAFRRRPRIPMSCPRQDARTGRGHSLSRRRKMAKQGFKAMDSDMHVFEPHDLWDRYIDPEFKDRAPKGLQRDFRDLGVEVEGKILPYPQAAGKLEPQGLPPEHPQGEIRRRGRTRLRRCQPGHGHGQGRARPGVSVSHARPLRPRHRRPRSRSWPRPSPGPTTTGSTTSHWPRPTA